ncbi:MAG: GyrI-like domain-containing protein [Proteobacteria bacterium]|nr:GyrI-like domain-containing protein [Pseudomonadota bacterium]
MSNTIRRFLFLSLAIVIFACAKPNLVPQDGRNYSVHQRGQELFVYVDYHWKGLTFGDAVALEKAFVTWAEKQGILVYAVGRFPAKRDWQLGFVATEIPEAEEFDGRKIGSLVLPAGSYASMYTIGHVDNMFLYWKKLAEWIGEEGREKDGPILEIYPDILKDLPDEQTRGELRYRLVSNK